MITIKDLSISFGGRKVIDTVSFEVPAGSTTVLMGKNGSGKSIILKAIAGLNRDYSGEICINGNDIRNIDRNRSGPARPGPGDFKLAYVFQKGGLFDSMDVYSNVAFGLNRLGIDPESIPGKIAESLRKVGLSGSEEKLPSQLSGGMQKRAGLARAISLEPQLILYDDPTAGLDPILSDSIGDLMVEIKTVLRSTAIAVTHDMNIAEKIGDSIILLYDGKIVYYGTVHEFFSGTNPYAAQFIKGDITGPIDIL